MSGRRRPVIDPRTIGIAVAGTAVFVLIVLSALIAFDLGRRAPVAASAPLTAQRVPNETPTTAGRGESQQGGSGSGRPAATTTPEAVTQQTPQSSGPYVFVVTPTTAPPDHSILIALIGSLPVTMTAITGVMIARRPDAKVDVAATGPTITRD